MKLMELYHDKIMGAISGLDRIRFRGTLRWLAHTRGLGTFMHQSRILLKDFSDWVGDLTMQVRRSCESVARERGIETRYLASSGVNKEKLARQIAEENHITEGIGYVKDGNCFPWIEDMTAAQRLLDAQLTTDWSALLNRLALTSCPALEHVLRPLRPHYYWSADETEWATDILFKSAAVLDRLYPSFLHHAMRVSDSPSVMRYLGRQAGSGRLRYSTLVDLPHRVN